MTGFIAKKIKQRPLGKGTVMGVYLKRGEFSLKQIDYDAEDTTELHAA